MECNGRIRKLMTGLAMLAATGNALAATAPTTLTAAAPAPAAADAGKMILGLTIAPSVLPANGSTFTEDAIELGYKFNPKVSLSYVQWFQTNINDTTSGKGETGLKVQTPVGYVRTKVKNILASESGNTTLSYQSRVYLPTSEADRAKGKIVSAMNYFTVKQKLSNVLDLYVSEIPVLQAYTQSGYKGKANPGFQNRVYVELDINFSDKLVLMLPVLMFQTRTRNYQASAANNDKWEFYNIINPELDYTINDTFTVGLGYYSDNLTKSDLSGFSMNEGLKAGVAQALLYVNL